MNRRAGRVRRVFKWAVTEELVPPAIYQALCSVEGFRKGRCDLPEPEPVGPVANADVRATLPHLPPAVRAMVEVQRLTGMRPGEVCRLRPCDIDRAGGVWVFRLSYHKLSHAGKDRAVPIGPRAQAVLAPFAPADASGYYFSPAATVADQLAKRSAARKTPRYKSHVARNAKKRKGEGRKREPGERYTTRSYYRAVERAVELVASHPRHRGPSAVRLGSRADRFGAREGEYHRTVCRARPGDGRPGRRPGRVRPHSRPVRNGRVVQTVWDGCSVWGLYSFPATVSAPLGLPRTSPGRTPRPPPSTRRAVLFPHVPQRHVFASSLPCAIPLV